MIRSVEIKGLRGIQEGKLDDLTPLVVLVGPNGCGKSTVLEALLVGAGQSPQKSMGYIAARRVGMKRGYEWLLTGKTDFAAGETPVLMSIRVTSGDCTRSVRFHSIEAFSAGRATFEGDIQEQCGEQSTWNTPIGIVFTDGVFNQNSYIGKRFDAIEHVRILEIGMDASDTPLHTLYTQAVRQGRRDEVVSLVREVVPGLSHIEILTEDETPIIHLVFKEGSIPVALAGDGIYALLHLCLELASHGGGIMLLEEPEAHKHPGAIRQSARAIWAAIRRDIQVVISTHSLELIDALLSEVQTQEELDKMSVYSLQLRDGCLTSFRTAGSDIAFARVQIGDDLR